MCTSNGKLFYSQTNKDKQTIFSNVKISQLTVTQMKNVIGCLVYHQDGLVFLFSVVNYLLFHLKTWHLCSKPGHMMTLLTNSVAETTHTKLASYMDFFIFFLL